MRNKFGFVLIRPQLGENIGACARSMKNFGFKKLILVTPKFSFPNHKTKVTSVGAYDVIENTKLFKTTEEAVSEFDIVISLSARKRDVNKKHIKMRDFSNILLAYKDKNIGLMFGPEASGLTNEDLSFSNYILQIPTSKNFKSINLSHSVTIICFEIFKTLNNKSFSKKGKNIKISSKLKINSVVKYLTTLLEKKKFFLPKEKKQSMLLNIYNLFYRLEPNDKELRILASILSALSKNKH